MKLLMSLKKWFNTALFKSEQNKDTANESRRSALTKLVATSGAVALGASATVQAHKPADAGEEKEEREKITITFFSNSRQDVISALNEIEGVTIYE